MWVTLEGSTTTGGGTTSRTMTRQVKVDRKLGFSLGVSAWSVLLALLALTVTAQAQTCQTSGELDDATRSVIASSAQRFFDMAGKGDAASLRQNAVATFSSDFSAIETSVKDYQQALAGAQATPKTIFLLEAEGSAPIPNAEFYCGVFGKSGQTTGSAILDLTNLSPGRYAVVVLEAVGPTARTNFSLILQQAGAEWKLGGLFIKPAQVAGHDSDWFIARSHEYKSKGQMHNAWLFLLQGRSLASPLPFMSTLATDRLYDELQGVQPADVPVAGKTADLAVGETTYKLTALFPDGVGNDVDLIVKYQTADASNAAQVNQSNLAVIRALVAKYPEFRDAFAAVVARAVDPTGHDFGTLVAMKDIK